MSNRQKVTQNQKPIISPILSKQSRFPSPKDYEEHMTWRIRWYLIIAITIAYMLSLIGGLTGFWATKDPRYLLFIAPTALIPFVRYLVPMDKKQYELKMTNINADKELYKAKVQIQMLETELHKHQASHKQTP